MADTKSGRLTKRRVDLLCQWQMIFFFRRMLHTGCGLLHSTRLHLGDYELRRWRSSGADDFRITCPAVLIDSIDPECLESRGTEKGKKRRPSFNDPLELNSSPVRPMRRISPRRFIICGPIFFSVELCRKILQRPTIHRLAYRTRCYPRRPSSGRTAISDASKRWPLDAIIKSYLLNLADGRVYSGAGDDGDTLCLILILARRSIPPW